MLSSLTTIQQIQKPNNEMHKDLAQSNDHKLSPVILHKQQNSCDALQLTLELIFQVFYPQLVTVDD